MMKTELKKNQSQSSFDFVFKPQSAVRDAEKRNPAKIWALWCVRFGMAPESNGPVSLVGIYTDFS